MTFSTTPRFREEANSCAWSHTARGLREVPGVDSQRDDPDLGFRALMLGSAENQVSLEEDPEALPAPGAPPGAQPGETWSREPSPSPGTETTSFELPRGCQLLTRQ